MSKLKELTSHVFSPDGWLIENGYRHTDVQLAYALSVCDAIEHSKQIHAISADTGVGKTLAYLVVSALHNALNNKRVVIATHSIELLRQIEKDIPIANRITEALTDTTVPFSTRIGKQHYLDPDRIELLYVNLVDEGVELTSKHHELLSWAKTSALAGSGLISDWRQSFGALPTGVTEEAICLTKYSRDGANNAESRSSANAKVAGIVITTHAMMINAAFTEVLGNIGDITFLIDEGDKFENAAELIGNVFIPVKRIASIAKTCLSNLKSKKSKSLSALINLAYEYDNALRDMDTGKDIHFKHVGNEQVKQVKHCVSEIVQSMSVALKSSKSSLANLTAFNELQLINDFLSSFNKNISLRGLHFSKKRRNPAFLRFFQSPAAVIHRHLEKGASAIFTSATIRDMGRSEISFSFLASTLMVAESDMGVKASFSPRQYGDLQFFVPDNELPNPYQHGEVNSLWRRYVTDVIRYTQSRYERVLVLATSFDEVDALSILLKGHGAFHKQGTGLAPLVAQWEKNGGILVSPSVWEGFSPRLSDGSQMFSSLVITKLPYSVPCELKLGELRGRLASQGSHYSAEAIYYKNLTQVAMRRFCQGIGRAIRAETDQCDIYICDPRILGNIKLKQGFAKALPKRFEVKLEDACQFDGKVSIEKAAKTMDELEGWV